LKLGAKAAPAPAQPPVDSAPAEEPTDDLDFSTDDAGAEDQADTSSEETPTDDTATDDSGSSDKPFDDEPFDAGVEADEESDPKKFIEQLTGKLGQSLRKYTEDQGQPDFDLEKFAVNSLLSATHTGEMDSEDQKDIIKKVKSSGKGDGDEESTDDTETTDTETDDTETTDTETTDTETTDDGETTDTETTDTETTDDSENLFEDADEMPWADLWVQEGEIYYDKNRDCNYTVTKVDWKSNNIIYTSNCRGGRSVGENYKLNDNIFKSMIHDNEIFKVRELANSNNFEKLRDNTPVKTGWRAEFQRLRKEKDKRYDDILQKYKSGKIDQDEFEKSAMLAEMSLDDWKSKILIKIYDDNLKQGNTKILHILTRLVSFSDKINREEFIQDIQTEISDNEEMHYILDKLRALGVDVDSYEEEVDYNRMFENSFILKNIKKNNMFQEGSNDVLDGYEIYEVVEEGKKKKKKTKKDACYHKVRARYDVWPSAYASGALVKCRKAGAANWGNSTDESVDMEALKEKWSAKYKKSIDCNNPKGFSQKAHCQGKKK
jgi:hypothetical protein